MLRLADAVSASQGATRRQADSLLHFLHLDAPIDALQVEEAGLRGATRDTDVGPTRRQDLMDVLKHGLDFCLRALLATHDAVKSSFVKDQQERFLDDLRWLSDIHKGV